MFNYRSKMECKLIIFVCLLLQFIGKITTDFLECTKDSDCRSNDAVCNNNICECPFGNVFSLDHTACLPLVIGVGAECEDDKQCSWLLGRNKCANKKCECDQGWAYFQGQCKKLANLNDYCTRDDQCYSGLDIQAMVCKGKCVCNEGYYLRGNTDCRPITKELGPNDYCSLDSDCHIENSKCIATHCVISSDMESAMLIEDKEYVEKIPKISQGYNIDCNKNEDCSSKLKDSMCYPLTKKCICNRGYYLSEESDTCVAELGSDSGCTIDDECPHFPSTCKNGKCYCRKTYFSGKYLRSCQKPMTQDNFFCNNNDRCKVLGDEAICNSENRTCECKPNAKLDDNFLCKLTEARPCTEDNDCTEIENSVCIEEKCQCKQTDRLEGNICLPNIGGLCDYYHLCTIENAKCQNGKCSCVENFVPSDDNRQCLRVAGSLNSECERDLQCSTTIKYSECFEERCRCLEGHEEFNGTCHPRKFMGDLCTDLSQCHIMLKSKMQCRNSVCQCSADMQPTEDRLDCEIPSSTSSISIQVGTILFITTLHLLLKSRVGIM